MPIGKKIRRVRLVDVEKRHAEAPNTFEIPSLGERHGLRPGMLVKLHFIGKIVERMWVRVIDYKVDRWSVRYQGALANDPVFVADRIAPGDVFYFRPKHVATIDAAVPPSSQTSGGVQP